MATDKGNNGVRMADVKDTVRRQAKRLEELADRLSENGEVLSPQDKDLLKVGLLSWIQNCNREAEMFYITGNIIEFRRSQEFILGLVELST